MNRRVGGVVIAAVLALIGTITLALYVTRAEERARSGEELVEVYVVTTAVPVGTPAEEIKGLVTVEEVPLKVLADGAVDNLPSLAGTVAAVDLVPGEQLVRSRFLERAEIGIRGLGVDVPDDLVEITLELEPKRAVGGLLEPGQEVMVMASFEPFQLSRTVVPVDGEPVPLPGAVAEAVEGSTPNETDVLLRKVLVTAVQQPTSNAGPIEDDARLTTAPNTTVFVTLAVSPVDATRLVFTDEFGELYLSVERDTVPESSVAAQTRGSVLLDQVRAE
ncbi:MAG: RcpC/CpaB family pilus assembly protein [Actinomycetota bacterium]